MTNSRRLLIINRKEKSLRNGTKITSKNWLYNEKHVLPFLKNKDDAFNYTKASESKISWKCPFCNTEKVRRIGDVVRRGYNCHVCGDTTSTPEKIALCFLDSLEIEYEYQKIFSGKSNRIFDFYIPSMRIAIEINGEQHYKDNGLYNYHKSIKSDKEKEVFCKNHNINLYFIDCRVVNVSKEIEKLNNIIEFRHFNVDVSYIKELLGKRNNNSMYKDISKLYSTGNSTDYIANLYGISKGKVNNILVRLGIDLRNSGRGKKKVICLNNNMIFDSIADATKFAGLKNTINICDVCNGKQKTAGKDPITREKLKWSYL